MIIGIIAAIGASFSWTFACFMWRQQARFFTSIQLNLIKNLIAFVVFSPVLFSIDWFSSYREIFILILSGLIGIAIGDSLYIKALNRLGTRKTITIEAFSPIFANILSTFFIGEIY